MAAQGAAASPTPPFFMYTDPRIDFGWMKACSGFDTFRDSIRAESFGEVALRANLVNHPARVHDPDQALLFYVPVWEFTSTILGACNGTTHAERMHLAATALSATPSYRRYRGADHFWASTMYEILSDELPGHNASKGRQLLYLRRRMGSLANVLHYSIVGRHKPFPKHHPNAIGSCIFEMPYLGNSVGQRLMLQEAARRPKLQMTALSAAPQHRAGDRSNVRAAGKSSTFLYFAGSLDVCCSGTSYRCALVPLIGEPGVVIEPSFRKSNEPLGKCNEAAHTRLLQLQGNASAGGGRSAGVELRQATTVDLTTLHADESSKRASRRSRSSPYEAMGRAMFRSTFCLTPAGDTFATSRFYSAIAAGCLPVFPGGDGKVAPFKRTVNYSAFVITMNGRAFLRDPRSLVRMLAAMPQEEIERRQGAMQMYAPDVLYEVPGSRVGDNVLYEAMRCRNRSIPPMRAPAQA